MGYRDDFFDDAISDHGWYTCVRCGRKLRRGDVDVDHILPQNRGGSDDIMNLQCMCKHCNRSKQDDSSLTFIDKAFRFMERQMERHYGKKAYKEFKDKINNQ